MNADEICEIIRSCARPDAVRSCSIRTRAGRNETDLLRVIDATVTDAPAVCVDLARLSQKLGGGITDSSPETVRVEGKLGCCECVVNLTLAGV
jgi:hypothetical protein